MAGLAAALTDATEAFGNSPFLAIFWLHPIGRAVAASFVHQIFALESALGRSRGSDAVMTMPVPAATSMKQTCASIWHLRPVPGRLSRLQVNAIQIAYGQIGGVAGPGHPCPKNIV